MKLILPFVLLVNVNAWAKNKRLDSVDCEVTKQTYGSVLECGDDLYSVKSNSAVEKGVFQICRENFKCRISFEVNARDEVTKVLSAFTKGKKEAKKFRTSFDCNTAKSYVEKTVCTNEELAKLDNQLGAKIKRLLETSESTKPIRDQQKTWLKDKRDPCQTMDCLLEVYKSRLDDLEAKE